MPILGFGIAFLGYSVLYYGLTQIRGLNYGFLDLVIPGKFAKATGVPPDATTTTTKPGAYGAVGQTPAQAAQPAGRPSPVIVAPATTTSPTGSFPTVPGTVIL